MQKREAERLQLANNDLEIRQIQVDFRWKVDKERLETSNNYNKLQQEFKVFKRQYKQNMYSINDLTDQNKQQQTLLNTIQYELNLQKELFDAKFKEKDASFQQYKDKLDESVQVYKISI